MMKEKFRYLSIALILMIGYQTTAQTLPFTKKKSYITIGYAYPYAYTSNFKSLERFTEAQGGTFDCTSIGPIFANYEYAISSTLGIGAAVSYVRADYSATIDSRLSSYLMQRLGVVFRMGWHPLKIKSWDPYLTGSIGYNVEIGEQYVYPELFFGMRIPAAPDVIYNAALGVRYFKPESGVGFYLEAGYSNSYLLQGGIAFRLGPDTEQTRTVW